MAIFKHSTVPGRAKPEGGYGSYGTPARAQRMSVKSSKPGKDSGKSVAAHKPKGGYGSYGKPSPKASKPAVTTGEYASDGMSWPTAKPPTDERKLFNLPRVKLPRR